MLVQNPPSIPTLAIAQFMCFFRNTQLVIDWHNFGYSILALKLGPKHPLVIISRLYENIFGRSAPAHFTVTNVMAKVLERAANIKALPLHDRPPNHFQPLSNHQRSDFLKHLPETRDYAKDIENGRWRLVVSSTSWTVDEDFSILLEALKAYSAQATAKTFLPNILAIITGKGPQKEYYLHQIEQLNKEKLLPNVVIKTAWLSIEDYASLLGAADLGISLHTSSSGVDLPMKVVDMFGTGLPVLGWDKYEAWPELVTEDVDGKGFGSSEQLAQLLLGLFGEDGEKLRKLRRGAMKQCEKRWDDEWDSVAGRVFGVAE
jgi:beta-1,4-mannosyltransferase